MPCRAKFSASRRSINRDSRETLAMTCIGDVSTSGRTACHWLTIRSTVSCSFVGTAETLPQSLDVQYLNVNLLNMKMLSGGAGLAGLTVLAPIAWGTTYITVTELFPPDRPLFVAMTRVLPAGLALVVAAQIVSRWRPRGADW